MSRDEAKQMLLMAFTVILVAVSLGVSMAVMTHVVQGKCQEEVKDD